MTRTPLPRPQAARWRRWLCKLGLHRWVDLSGIAPPMHINRECIYCGSRKFHRLRGHDYEAQWATWEEHIDARDKYFASGGKDDDE